MPAVDCQDLSLELRPIDSLTAAEQIQWNGWMSADPVLASPFFRVEYALIAGPHCPGSCLAVFKRGGEVVGYYPFQRRGGTVQPLGAPMNDYHGVIGPIERRPTLEQAAALLNANCFNVTAWIGEASSLNLSPSYRAVIKAGHTYDDWYAERRTAFAKYFKDKERARRSLEAQFGTIEVEVGINDPALLNELLRLKSAQYARSGLHDIFACGWTVNLLQALMISPYPDFGGSLCTLKAGGKIYALEYSLAAGRCYHFWFPAYYAEAGRVSPGILLSMDTIRRMSERGFTDFDYGTGSDGYKRYFCDKVQMVGEGRIRRPGLRDLTKVTVRKALNLGPSERVQRLKDRVRRRWNVIEACETTFAGRVGGIASAAKTAIKKRD